VQARTHHSVVDQTAAATTAAATFRADHVFNSSSFSAVTTACGDHLQNSLGCAVKRQLNVERGRVAQEVSKGAGSIGPCRSRTAFYNGKQRPASLVY
jgi:hypothetical protein